MNFCVDTAVAGLGLFEVLWVSALVLIETKFCLENPGASLA